MVFFLENVFSTFSEVFDKNQKDFKVGEVGNYDEETE